MRSRVAVLAVVMISLACGGLPAAPLSSGSADLSAISGRWCEEDPEVGCYRFEGSTVYEEEVQLKRGWKPANTGTWSVEGGMLLMRFESGTWTLDPIKYTGTILIVKDWSQDDTFTFVKRD